MNPKTRQTTWTLLHKQSRFFHSKQRECLYSGAFGSGKSRAVCMKLVARACRPGAREALCRKHLVTLKNSTLRTLLDPEGALPPVLVPGTYTHHRTDKRIRIHGGGEICYFGLDEPGKIASMNFSGVGIDQAEELTVDDYNMLRGRLRMTVDELPNQIYSACNPSAPTHWLAVRFGLDGIHPLTDGCMAVITRSSDNTFLPDSYLADLETFEGLAYKRFVLGEWCGSEGLVYDTFDRALHVIERRGPWVEVLAGLDWGYRNPSAIVAIGRDESGGFHAIDEFYGRGLLESQLAEAAQRLRHEHGVGRFICDPSAAALIETFRRANLDAEPGNNDVFGGISRVQKCLAIDGQGRPGLTISPRCRSLIEELGVYEWMPGKDKPVKANDHALDALRYGVMHLTGGTPFRVDVINVGGGQQRSYDDDNDPAWTVYGQQA